MRKYKIGQLSKMMGVSSHLLKHYEKFDLVIPDKCDDTNYRYYDISQCARIIESKKYRNMGFGLKEIRELMNEDTNEEMKAKVREQISCLESEIANLTKQRDSAKLYMEQCEEIDGKLGEWYVEKCPALIFLKHSIGKKINEKADGEEGQEQFMEELPNVVSALYIKKDTFWGNEAEYSWGMAKKWNGATDNFPKQEPFIYIEERKAFVTYLKVEAPYMDNGRLFSAIQEKYEEFRDKIPSDVIAMRYKDVQEEEREVSYFAIYIPIN
ncbi:MAG: MerR family transcriptional regulator [Lachnospiraceae bacterium]|nr:MerR family transcriptional regulator [Lachnospiraceae bacterium]